MTAPNIRVRTLVDADPVPVNGSRTLHAAEVRVRPQRQPTSFFQHGWHSFSATGWIDPSLPPEPIAIPALRMVADDPAHTSDTWHSGAGLGAIVDHTGEVLLLGALGLDARVHLIDGELVGRTEHGAEVAWFIARGSDPDVFTQYARQVGNHLGRRLAPSPRLWSSWYSYYEDITEAELRTTLDTVGSWPVDVFQVDDGWQQAVGDWEANNDFPSGMADLATRIQAAGVRPGLWIAPFIAWPSSRLFQEHPDWFVAGDDGSPLPVGHNWRDWYYALDLSRDDVLDHIAQVIATACGWGFSLLKLDFLFAGAVPGIRHAAMPREAMYRRAVDRIRQAAGDGTYLLACGAPIMASVGVFDAIRISSDVSPFWDNPVLTEVVGATSEVSTRGAIATSLHRLWLREVIATDPDVVFFRTRYNLMDASQRRDLQDLAVLAGFRGTSDPPGWLSDEEVDELIAYLATDPQVIHLDGYRYTIDGRPVDLTRLAHRPRPVGSASGPRR